VKHPVLRLYCRLLAGAPLSVTGVRDPDEIWRLHVEDARTALPVLARLQPTTLVDVGSGGGSPGIPLGLETGLPTVLLESRRGKAGFLRSVAAQVGGHFEVINERSETFGRGRGRDAYDLALARALAPPPAAAELCLPLVRPGGHVLLWTAGLDAAPLDAAARRVGGELAEIVETGGTRALARRRPLGAVPSPM
jgi:16S rRNA (guanine527-N7)-methyltransferase